ncbi:hypothetical protein I5M27_13125 [Adhaeribacter sp. BT258]|uniref:Uncharacterized protein n=1 Tax=Adhaeribacter terrigena TaxID=2793070 RepID=A0ABS1C3E7_9BACT|nr:hypothetical protein [Adhaeribacter terrigena]MBK0403931.1 hypothetical protein [Adhaeribacter terrigena]
MKPNFNLEDLKHENVYNVPENYFDKLPNRIMQRVTSTPAETSEAGSWFPKPLRLALAGSGFAAVFATVFMLNMQEDKTPRADMLAQVPQTEIMNYLLATEQMERSDLAILNAADQDLTHEFIAANSAEIRHELEEIPLDESYY